MIELLTKGSLGKIRPDTISFLIKYAITDVSQENVDVLTKKLSDELLCFDPDCDFELDIDYDKESEVMLSAIVYYPTSKWPENKSEQKKIIDKYSTKISQIYKKITESGL